MMQDLEVYQANELSEPMTSEQVGEFANEVSRSEVFSDFIDGKAANTKRRYKHEIGRFAEYVYTVHKRAGVAPLRLLDLFNKTEDWKDITWGLVKKYRDSLVDAGYAIGTINISLSTVRLFAKLAFQAGELKEEEYRLMSTIGGYSHKQGQHVDDKRKRDGINTRIEKKGAKKATHTKITDKQAHDLIHDHEDTPQGRRDSLLMCILIDHGLRVSEVAILKLGDINLDDGEICFLRPKVRGTRAEKTCQILTQDTKQAAENYILTDCMGRDLNSSLWQGSRKSKEGLLKGEMSMRAITKRVQTIGQWFDIPNLSPHDLRHYSATRDARRGKLSIVEIRDKFGWSGFDMPNRYIDGAKKNRAE